jgi:hypothetical protein
MQFQVLMPLNAEQNQQADVIRWKLQNPRMEFSFEKILDGLDTLFSKYRTWNDLTSRNIREWGSKIFEINVNEEDLFNPENLLKRTESLIHHLFHKVLVSPFLSPFKEPILDGDFTWEKSELINYCAKYAFTTRRLFSPFGKEIKIEIKEDGIHFPNMKTHQFALDLICWANNLPIEPIEVKPQLISIHNFIPLPHLLPLKNEENADLVALENSTRNVEAMSPQEKLAHLQIYKESAQIAAHTLISHKIAEQLTKATKELKTSREEIEEFTRLSIARIEADAKRQKEEVERAINQANESRAAEVKVFNGRIDDHKIQIKTQFEMLSYQEQQLALKDARINHLAELYRQEQAKVQHMANSDRGGGGCNLF